MRLAKVVSKAGDASALGGRKGKERDTCLVQAPAPFLPRAPLRSPATRGILGSRSAFTPSFSHPPLSPCPPPMNACPSSRPRVISDWWASRVLIVSTCARPIDPTVLTSPVWNRSNVAQPQAHLVHVRELFGRMIVELMVLLMSIWMSLNPQR